MFDQHLGFGQRGEVLAVEQLVTQLAIEALIMAVLLGAFQFDEQGLYANPRQPFTNSSGGELTALVGTDMIE
jgi:hypothetical protein